MKCSICNSEAHFRAKCPRGSHSHGAPARSYLAQEASPSPSAPGPLDGLLSDVDTVQTFMNVESQDRPVEAPNAQQGTDPWTHTDPWSTAPDWSRLSPADLEHGGATGANLWEPYAANQAAGQSGPTSDSSSQQTHSSMPSAHSTMPMKAPAQGVGGRQGAHF